MGKRIVILIAALALSVGLAWAAAVKAAVTGYVVSTSGSVEKQWVDDGGMIHTRGYSGEGLLIGDLAGKTYTTNGAANLDPVTGNGDQHGKFRFVGKWNGVQGVFEGSWGGKIVGFYYDGQIVAQGSSGFEGLKLKARHHGWLTPPGSPPIPQTYYGYILDPGK
ncbi:MAG: hypothetical protein ACYS99_03815 [Planctomycetota bacterium]|jgi:hypothetical protein